jgi:hypothetical protein
MDFVLKHRGPKSSSAGAATGGTAQGTGIESRLDSLDLQIDNQLQARAHTLASAHKSRLHIKTMGAFGGLTAMKVPWGPV